MTPVALSHIWLDDRGVAWIDATNVKVIEVAAEWRSTGMSPEEMVYQHYGSPNLAQTMAALTYYLDNQAAFDAEIDRRATEADRLRAANLDSPGRRRLRAMGKLP
jgi:uncharacterized protein (DUF433 family)